MLRAPHFRIVLKLSLHSYKCINKIIVLNLKKVDLINFILIYKDGTFFQQAKHMCMNLIWWRYASNQNKQIQGVL